jgi:hypothetical protein
LKEILGPVDVLVDVADGPNHLPWRWSFVELYLAHGKIDFTLCT